MIRPLSTQVVLEKCGVPIGTPGSKLIIPESAHPDSYEYRIISAGVKVPYDLKPGMRVVASPWEGKDFEHEGKQMRLVHFKELQLLIGVVSDE